MDMKVDFTVVANAQYARITRGQREMSVLLTHGELAHESMRKSAIEIRARGERLIRQAAFIDEGVLHLLSRSALAEVAPNCYLSASGGKWRIITQGIPICADKESKAEALAAAATMKIAPHSQKMWNGDIGEWVNPNLDFSSIPACV